MTFREALKINTEKKAAELPKFESMVSNTNRVNVAFIQKELGWDKDQIKLMLVNRGFRHQGQTIYVK